jgi:hypothetical protein
VHERLGGPLLAALALLGSNTALAATVPGLYEATVPLAERSERGQSEALQAAMRQVLVRITGRRDAGEDVTLSSLVTEARRYVQQFRVVGGNQFFAAFDGAKLERAVTDAGQNVWGHERPATLVILVDDVAKRVVTESDTASDLRNTFLRGATLRGLPVRWPNASRPIDYSVATASAPEALQAAAVSYDADAVLVGRAIGSAATGWQVRWTLTRDGEHNQWRGSPEDGAQGAADWFVQSFARTPASDGGDVAITVNGVASLRAYASVTEFLESLSLVRSLSVDQLSGDTVVYRARVQGDVERLGRAIELGGRLERLASAGDVGAGALSFRYRP